MLNITRKQSVTVLSYQNSLSLLPKGKIYTFQMKNSCKNFAGVLLLLW